MKLARQPQRSLPSQLTANVHQRTLFQPHERTPCVETLVESTRRASKFGACSTSEHGIRKHPSYQLTRIIRHLTHHRNRRRDPIRSMFQHVLAKAIKGPDAVVIIRLSSQIDVRASGLGPLTTGRWIQDPGGKLPASPRFLRQRA